MSNKETYDPSSGLRYFDRVFGDHTNVFQSPSK